MVDGIPINSQLFEVIYQFYRWQCPFKLLRRKPIPSYGHAVEKINTAFDVSWRIFDVDQGPYAYQNATPLCKIGPHSLGQFGIYNLTINKSGCEFSTVRSPVNVISCNTTDNQKPKRQ